MRSFDNPERYHQIQALFESKPILLKLYQESYRKFERELGKCPQSGFSLEIGSGCGFLKKYIPAIITSDIVPYPGVEKTFDATGKFPFKNQELHFVCLLNTLHHIPDAESMFREISRCLLPGGRIFIIDQHPGWIGHFIYRWIHHESYNAKSPVWKFDSQNPLGSANGALTWIIFKRDKEKFAKLFPDLKVVSYSPHTPFRYWLSGGMKTWSLMPEFLDPVFQVFEKILCSISREFGSFVDIEIIKE